MRGKRAIPRMVLFSALFLLILVSYHRGIIPGVRATMPGNPTYIVSMHDYIFDPTPLAVHSGDTVNWTVNDPTFYGELYFEYSDSTPATLSPYLSPGMTFSLTFPQQCITANYVTIGSSVTRTGTVNIRLQGDVNGDRKVNIFDLTAVAGIFGATVGSPNFNPAADLNNDGKINIFDLTLVGSHFGQSC